MRWTSRNQDKNTKRQHTFLIIPSEFLDKVIDHTVIGILTSSGFDLKDTLLDHQKGDIKGTFSRINDEYGAFTNNLFVKTINNSSNSRLIYDVRDIHTGNMYLHLIEP